MPPTHESTDHRGTPCLRLRNEGATALVALHGAQLLSWIPADGRERLFLGERAQFTPGSAIRGGVPVVFPQFGERGNLRKHGFARLLDWTFEGVTDDAAIFELRDGPDTAQWPHAFACRLSIGLAAARLAVALEVENRGAVPFDFTAALHTYLRVDDIAQVSLEGLQGCDYEDSANGGTLHRQHEHAVAFDGEIDRIYNDVVAPLILVDGGHRLDIKHDGFGDTIVWNPGAHLAARIGDLAPGEHARFACVEAGQVLAPVLLAPGERWRGSQALG
ncbi:D-hexose-6-phosphate mutarotase [Luteimonas marina]|uniref:Putative glucose-6-phosphate 1-epimerase n=1 Tax=Luteimonas marina TaxID=488485 RepID=A0A5C5U3U9_9GAMM|nr:D-hexose-6-phosphate mutarotase [Luteimonas marina]TWT20368.1 D-hexose-6-phosphate mutarotase [Luteimonas marina]